MLHCLSQNRSQIKLTAKEGPASNINKTGLFLLSLKAYKCLSVAYLPKRLASSFIGQSRALYPHVQSPGIYHHSPCMTGRSSSFLHTLCFLLHHLIKKKKLPTTQLPLWGKPVLVYSSNGFPSKPNVDKRHFRLRAQTTVPYHTFLVWW